MDDINPTENHRYLTADQLDAVREQLTKVGENTDAFLALALTVDSFVRNNNRADAEYEAIYTVIQTLDLMQSNQLEYTPTVRNTLPFLTALAFYDYLLITGVIAPEELKKMGVNFGPMGGTPTA